MLKDRNKFVQKNKKYKKTNINNVLKNSKVDNFKNKSLKKNLGYYNLKNKSLKKNLGYYDLKNNNIFFNKYKNILKFNNNDYQKNSLLLVNKKYLKSWFNNYGLFEYCYFSRFKYMKLLKNVRFINRFKSSKYRFQNYKIRQKSKIRSKTYLKFINYLSKLNVKNVHINKYKSRNSLIDDLYFNSRK